MTYDGEDDLFDEEFDFVDEEDDDLGDDDLADSDTEEATEDTKESETESAPKKKPRPAKAKGRTPRRGKKQPEEAEESDSGEAAKKQDEESAGEDSDKEVAPEVPPVPTDYVVHLYEFGDFTRTIPREFTEEDAAAFAVEYNRTADAHSRHAVAPKKDDVVAHSVTSASAPAPRPAL